MSNTGKFKDQTPFLRNAGVTTATQNVTSDHSLRQDIYFKPRTVTPEHIKKYRKSIREQPGLKQVHYGVYDDPKDFEEYTHGNKTLASEHVPECIKGNNLSGVGYFLNSIKEDKYARSQREPLGKSIIRNYNFPEKVKEEEFKFGIPSSGTGFLKDLLYTGAKFNETQEIKTMYNKSHGLTDPGEQKDRSYKWYVDKNSHAFGKTEPKEADGTKKSLSTDYLEAQFPKTKIVNKRLEDFRQATSDMVGQPKFKGTLNANIDDDHRFGSKNVLAGNWNVAKCIHGDPEQKTIKHIEPDLDLGKTVVYRSRMQNLKPKEFDVEKTFGVPSIRQDLNPKTVSISDLTNYGNEKDAYDLLYPNPHNVRGIDDPDLGELIDREELQNLLNRNSYSFLNEEFNIIYEIALRNYPNYQGRVSYKAFINVMRNLKREYMNYRTLLA